MEKETKKKVIWGIVSAVAVIVVLFFVFHKSDNSGVAVPEQSNTPVVETPAVTTPVSTHTAPVKVLSYEEAIRLYKDTRIQLSEGSVCVAVPNAATFKNGTNVMIDNRAPVTRAVKLGNTYSVPGYGFKIIKLSSDTLPVTWLLDCGTQQNVATIFVQK